MTAKHDGALSRAGGGCCCFLHDDCGAVTVDWVVLTATIIALSVLTIGVVHTSVSGLANVVETSVEVTRLHSPDERAEDTGEDEVPRRIGNRDADRRLVDQSP